MLNNSIPQGMEQGDEERARVRAVREVVRVRGVRQTNVLPGMRGRGEAGVLEDELKTMLATLSETINRVAESSYEPEVTRLKQRDPCRTARDR